jgi:hypothetical protein
VSTDKQREQWRASARRAKAKNGERVRETNRNACRKYRESTRDKAKQAVQHKASKSRLKDFIRAKKAVPCADCQQSYPYYVMHFDHRPGADKLLNISQMAARNFGKEAILEEIAKCDVVCANCHAERTWGNR